MPEMSIREFASTLNTSHNTVRNVMKELEADMGIVIGLSLGKGKATLLSNDEQSLIKARFNPATKPHTQVEIVPYVPTQLEKTSLDSPVSLATFKTVNTEVYSLELTERLETDISTVQSNTTALDNALLLKLQSEGQLLGVQLFEAKYGTAFSTLNDLEQKTAKKQGLTA